MTTKRREKFYFQSKFRRWLNYNLVEFASTIIINHCVMVLFGNRPVMLNVCLSIYLDRVGVLRVLEVCAALEPSLPSTNRFWRKRGEKTTTERRPELTTYDVSTSENKIIFYILFYFGNPWFVRWPSSYPAQGRIIQHTVYYTRACIHYTVYVRFMYVGKITIQWTHACTGSQPQGQRLRGLKKKRYRNL